MITWYRLLFCSVGCIAMLYTAASAPAAPPDTLPPDLRQIRSRILAITFLNTDRSDNILRVREQLEPLIAPLAEWFNDNRPADEITLTQQSWRNLWYDDPDIEAFSSVDFGPIGFEQDRRSISQVVEDGYYYNVSQSTVRFFGRTLTFQNFLKGAYTIAHPAGPGTSGEPRRNVVDLEFVANGIRLGPLPLFMPPSTLVEQVESGRRSLIPVPGPIGVTGKLWNLYIDEDLRISAGIDDDEPDVIDLYILTRGR